MCIIVYKPEGAAMPSTGTLRRCFEENPDGAGFMWPERGRVQLRKGFMGWGDLESALSKMIAKTWLKTAKIKDVGAYFAVSDAAKEIGTWDSRLQVTSHGYMLGYNDLRDPSVSGFFRFLARVGDNGMKMQIVKIRL